MGGTSRWPHKAAWTVAEELAAALVPFVDRITIAGSLRRQKPTVGDIELLFVPRHETRQADMFATEQVDLAGEQIERLLITGEITKRPSKTGAFTWGPKNKLALHRSGIAVDFFATTLENWWVSLVVRTGGKETNLSLTTGAQNLGRSLNAYGCGVTNRRTGEITPATSEEHVFQLCGVPYLSPEQRT